MVHIKFETKIKLIFIYKPNVIHTASFQKIDVRTTYKLGNIRQNT